MDEITVKHAGDVIIRQVMPAQYPAQRIGCPTSEGYALVLECLVGFDVEASQLSIQVGVRLIRKPAYIGTVKQTPGLCDAALARGLTVNIITVAAQHTAMQ